MISQQQLKQAVSDIPPLSSGIVKIMNMLNSESEIDFNDLENKIIQEPSLTGRVLKLANSPFYGMPGEINSIKEACLILGINSIRNLVISSAMIEQFPTNSKTNLDFYKLWHHSVATAAGAKVIARHCNINQEQSFTAGLLHDIGKMIFEVHFSEHYMKVIEHQKQKDCLIFDSEKEILGTDHTELGALTAERWHLSDSIINTIRHHHNPEKSTSAGIDHVVNLANIIARGLGLGNPGDDLIPSLESSLLDLLKLDIEQIKGFLSEIEASSENFMTLID